MKQILGLVLIIGGLAGVLFFGYQYLDASDSFRIFGADVAVSTGDYVPVLISAVVLVAGLFVYRSK